MRFCFQFRIHGLDLHAQMFEGWRLPQQMQPQTDIQAQLAQPSVRLHLLKLKWEPDSKAMLYHERGIFRARRLDVQVS
jgi:hypothetical protein